MTEPQHTPWHLKPGDSIERKQLHATFGGRTQGGIGPSAKTPNVMVFTDPIAGEKHGYYDGWMHDGYFHYSGEGQYGDQRMISGNASILHHKAEGRALRVFQGARGLVTYIGKFEIAAEQPYYEADAPETNGGPVRKVIVFRLRPVDAQPQDPTTRLGRLLEATDNSNPVQSLPLEQHLTEKMFVEPNREAYEAERKESKLVAALADYLRARNLHAERHQILPAGETRPLYTDVYVGPLNLLVEAKGSVTREHIRMAIGQLADYSRYLPNPTKAILVPSEPRADLLDLAGSQDCVVIWPEGKGYHTTPSIGL
ncbi:restriction endonuclease [Kitasatospora sp. CB01950]|uniref:restriction endonuclease n=1 Tax=Kitasatospora sp. CB01950 TaxID=1703930 RepID=UPI00093F140C|nr:restriction endonuclease [Kitasatospora sp. CB01950]OKJ16786.1 restriction endonuclease [Kitasatospora sp. CB01950]